MFAISLCQETPLHFAATEGNMDAAQFLIHNGADVNIKDKDGVGTRDCTTDGKLVLLIKHLSSGLIKFTHYFVHSYEKISLNAWKSGKFCCFGSSFC